MNRRLVSLAAFLALAVASQAWASDEEGCLFCHRLEIRRATARGAGELRVRDATGPHADLYCSDCHSDAKTAPHPQTPGPAACIGECHAPSPGARETHRRASFGGMTESHRMISAPDAPCRLCHKATDEAGKRSPIASRCEACHARERESVAAGVHGRVDPSGGGLLCGSCHRAHPPPGAAPARAGCGGTGCHSGVTEEMRRLAAHGAGESKGRDAGKGARAGVFLALTAIGWISGRLLSPSRERKGGSA